MEQKTITILDIPFLAKRFEEVAGLLAKHIRRGEKAFIVTANPEIVMYAKNDEEYKRTLKKADYIVPDGFGVILGSRMLKNPLPERVAGYDLTIRLLEMADKEGLKVYLLGGKEEANQAAASNISQKYPGLTLVGRHHGYFSWEDGKISDEIEMKEPDIVLVALGYPKQEQWIAENIGRVTKGIFIGVGGSIDVLAGIAKRAPEVWRRMNLEWLYRLVKQPSRWRRMLMLPKFVIEVLKIK
ncbi:acetylglucosaminyldiphospho-UDP acetyl-beta-D-mannosaminyltransferase [Bacillus sp. FJAT-18017]|uniref:WecB/TagA/CpsF family glycosyltransferase n=1 Tax=Bacillus sp. FJAT-18017 TaxID=1705566 RepID=UPI0006AE2086|nr:WecB/TagA/CpsF family glycosyltransferase [Bacillus sp. FJAT-18017]ALC88775.1 acetylglucosaminyldiphospho-UDP acetyl-beta-D-mannosaminyltransferase [Bacillus sp. FJAT-18017]